MKKKTINQAMEYYESIDSYKERQKLQKEFGHENEPNREIKFYRWFRDNKL